MNPARRASTPYRTRHNALQAILERWRVRLYALGVVLSALACAYVAGFVHAVDVAAGSVRRAEVSAALAAAERDALANMVLDSIRREPYTLRLYGKSTAALADHAEHAAGLLRDKPDVVALPLTTTPTER